MCFSILYLPPNHALVRLFEWGIRSLNWYLADSLVQCSRLAVDESVRASKFKKGAFHLFFSIFSNESNESRNDAAWLAHSCSHCKTYSAAMRLFQYFLIRRSSFIPVCSCNILVHNSIENVNRCVRTLLSVQGTGKKEAKNLLTHRNAAHLSI